VAILAALPAVVSALPVHVPAMSSAELQRRIGRSTNHPYQGYSVVSGTLSLPDVPVFGDMTTLLSSTTQFRAWVAAPNQWRVDQLSVFGETDTYMNGQQSVTWQSERHRVTVSPADEGFRLPRGDDLLPPELGRRLVGAASPNQLTHVAPRRVAGVAAAGLRITPSSNDTTIASVDVWADPHTGLPVEVEVYAKGVTHPILTTKFLDLSQSRPGTHLVTFSPGKGAVSSLEGSPGDPVAIWRRITSGQAAVGPRPAPINPDNQLLRRFPYFDLPASLGPLPQRSRSGAIATYGSGFNVVAVAQVAPFLVSGDDSPLQKLPKIKTALGPAPAVSTPLLNGLAVQVGRRSYVLVGSVSMNELRTLTGALSAEVGGS
jgi:hypothetical protein